MDEFEAVLNLTEKCRCVDDDDDPMYDCYDCDGKGEVLTDEGRQLLKFFRKFMFADID
jgi:hypothetical protein